MDRHARCHPEPNPKNLNAMNLQDLKRKTPTELLAMAEELNIETASTLRRPELMFTILQAQAELGTAIYGDGVIEVLSDGFGFLRSPESNYLPGPDDIYVAPQILRRHSLRTGDTVDGQIRAPKDGERYFALTSVRTINFDQPEVARHRVNFDNLTPLYPEERLRMEVVDQTPTPPPAAPAAPAAPVTRARGAWNLEPSGLPTGFDAPDHRPDRADRKRSACADHRAAAYRQDRDAAEHRELDRSQSSGMLPDRPADR